MPVSEFGRWMAYAEEEPFGQPWENWLMAVQAWQFACAHTGNGKNPPKFQNFMYKGPAARERDAQRKVDSFVSFLEGKT